jgi:hypothetical protein
MTRTSSTFPKTFPSLRILFLAIFFALIGTARGALAQYLTSQTLPPPPYVSDAYGPYPPLSQPMILHYQKNWPLQNGGSSVAPNPMVERMSAVGWQYLEPTSPGSFVWGSLFVNPPTPPSTCASPGDAWIPYASCYNPAGATGLRPGNLFYTFLQVPGWASSGGTTWTVSSAAVSSCDVTSNYCVVIVTVTIPSGVTLPVYETSGVTDLISVSGVSDSGGHSLTATNASLIAAPVSLGSNSYQLSYKVSYWIYGDTTSDITHVDTCTTSCVLSGAEASYGSAYPPSDINSGSETCTVAVNTSEKGNCYFRAFVDAFMQQNCPGVTVNTPQSNVCAIHYFEGWNEFNSDGYWQGTYWELARMMLDANDIIKAYCSDCYFAAGSVSAGGDGYHQHETANPTDESPIYSIAMGQLLADWYNQQSRHLSTPVPDALSVHPYPSNFASGATVGSVYENPNPFVPMPETNVTFATSSLTEYDLTNPITPTPTGCPNNNPYASTCYNPYANPGAGCNTPNAPQPYVTGTPGVARLKCRDSVINVMVDIGSSVAGVMSQVNSKISGASFNLNTPVWNTESGTNGYFRSDFFNRLPASGSFTDSIDHTDTALVDQAYVARQSILLAAAGSAATSNSYAAANASLNMWYQADNATYDPLYLNMPTVGWQANYHYASGSMIWDGHNIQVSASHTTTTSTPYYSGATEPNWSASAQGKKLPVDGDVVWETLVYDPTLVGSLAVTATGRAFSVVHDWFANLHIKFTGNATAWQAGQVYNLGDMVSDGAMRQQVTGISGMHTSGTAAPTWNRGMYSTTSDNGELTWTTVGTNQCWGNGATSNALASGIWQCPIIEESDNVTGWIVWYATGPVSDPDTLALTVYPTMATPGGITCERQLTGAVVTKANPPNPTVYPLPEIIDQSTSAQCH